MLCLWIDSQSSLTGLWRLGSRLPGTWRPSGKVARTPGVPGYFSDAPDGARRVGGPELQSAFSRRRIRQFWGFQFVKTNPPRLGGERFVLGTAEGFVLRGPHNLQNALIAARYQTLGEIARIARTAKIAKSRDNFFLHTLNEKPKKVLAFVVYSCYKMSRFAALAGQFLGHLQPCFTRTC
jgi:hypothetical protein